MPTAINNVTTRNLNDSRKQALQALISSLAPNASNEKKLSEEQVEALSDRLDQFLGNVDEGPEVRRNESGEVLNEEGLPIIDVSEPIEDTPGPSQSPEAFVSEHDPPPFSSLSEQERLQLRIRRDRILDILEEEERRESEKELERERVRRVEEVTKMDEKSKAAAREMQRKMGKALLKNLAAQREKEEEGKKKAEDSVISRASSQDCGASSKKPRKSVSFANVPEFNEAKPKTKPPLAWGDVSVTRLKPGVPKARLKAETLSSRPMKMEVVERIAGKERKTLEERDSDDESNPDVQNPVPSAADELGGSSTLNGNYEGSDESTDRNEKPEEDEFDLSEASIQREVALEYIRLRERVGAEARRAMTSHSHEKEDEWDRPSVPLNASLASRPSRHGVPQFKAERQANLIARNNASVSLGASVLPQDKSSALHRAVRTGRLENDQLIGGEPGESGSEDDDENVKRSIELLRNATVSIDNPSESVGGPSTRISGATSDVIERNSPSRSTSPQARIANSSSCKPSRFKAERIVQRQRKEFKPESLTQAPAGSSVVVDTVIGPSAANDLVRPGSAGSNSTIRKEQSHTASRKPPTVVPVPSVTPSQGRPFAKPLIPPDSVILSNMVVESPSFPPPDADAHTTPGPHHPPALVSEVRESTRRAGISEEPIRRTGKVSRFMSERL